MVRVFVLVSALRRHGQNFGLMFSRCENMVEFCQFFSVAKTWSELWPLVFALRRHGQNFCFLFPRCEDMVGSGSPQNGRIFLGPLSNAQEGSDRSGSDRFGSANLAGLCQPWPAVSGLGFGRLVHAIVSEVDTFWRDFALTEKTCACRRPHVVPRRSAVGLVLPRQVGCTGHATFASCSPNCHILTF